MSGNVGAHHFSYKLKQGTRVVRIGRAVAAQRSEAAALHQLRATITTAAWSQAVLTWHETETEAIRAERVALTTFAWARRCLPVDNMRSQPADLPVVVPCVGVTPSGRGCSNAALAVFGGRCLPHSGLPQIGRRATSQDG